LPVWLEWLWQGFMSGLLKVVALWWLVPLFIAVQWLKDSGLLGKVSQWLAPLLSPLRLPGDAGLPVAAGLAVGLTYGAGVILQTAEEGKLNRSELTVTAVFLGICHALIEETILFSAAGTSGVLLITLRVVLGLFFAYGASLLLLRPKAAAAQPGE
jgi:hypothetical protein